VEVEARAGSEGISELDLGEIDALGARSTTTHVPGAAQGALNAVVSFGSPRDRNSVAWVEPSTSSDRPAESDLQPWLPLAGVALGGLMTHWLTRRRERALAVSAWRQEVQTRHEPAYVRFLQQWQESEQPVRLADAFSVLESQVPVPSKLRASYIELYNVLAASDGTAKARRRAIGAFRGELDARLAPWFSSS
jgi:hypothetical protein